MEQEFETVEFTPPNAERVALRALVLAAVAVRSDIEREGQAGAANAEALRADLARWVADAGLEGELEPRERALLDAPVGTLSNSQVIDADWEIEGMAVLAWALGRLELPSYDQVVAVPQALRAIGFFTPEGAVLPESALLRDGVEIERFAEVMFAVHWRLREFSLRPNHMDFGTFAREASFGPLEIEGIPLADEDLAIDGTPLMDVLDGRWRECLSIVAERHRAANWLLGQDPLYSEVTADT